MKKGKGFMTRGQAVRLYENTWKKYLKLKRDYESLKIAHNKLLKEKCKNEK